MKKVIQSRENPLYKNLLDIKKRKNSDHTFLAEGEDLVFEANKVNALIYVITYDENYECPFDVDVIVLKENLFKSLCEFKSVPKVIGLCRKEYSEDFGNRVIYLDYVQDPGNVGTIIRTALAFNYSSVSLSKDSVSIYNSKLIQSSKGALFHLPISQKELKFFAERGYNIYLTSLDGKDESRIESLKEPFVLAFGNEGKGITPSNLELGEKLKIEMSGIDSLNVAVAAGIFMYRFKGR